MVPKYRRRICLCSVSLGTNPSYQQRLQTVKALGRAVYAATCPRTIPRASLRFPRTPNTPPICTRHCGGSIPGGPRERDFRGKTIRTSKTLEAQWPEHDYGNSKPPRNESISRPPGAPRRQVSCGPSFERWKSNMRTRRWQVPYPPKYEKAAEALCIKFAARFVGG